MQTQNAVSNIRPVSAEGPSLNNLIATILRGRLTVLIVTVVVTACGLSLAFINAKYMSQGFFQFGGPIPMIVEKDKEKAKNKSGENKGDKDDKDKEMEPGPGITLSDFKRYAAAYSTNERFNEYVAEKKLDSVAGIEDLRRTFARDGIAKIVEPVYPFTKLDAKVLLEQPKGSSNNVIGLRIAYEGNSPETAQQMVGLLGRYAMDSIVYLIYSDALRFKNEEIGTKLTELDSRIIRNKILLDEYRRRASELKQIIARNPGAASQGTRQVIEINEDTAHYLPPTTLLTTTEVRAAEANETILKAKHEQLQNQLLHEYYGRVESMLDQTHSGETVLRNLEAVKESVFKAKNMQDDVVKEVFNMITIDNQKAINVYLNKSRFIAGPTLPPHSTTRFIPVLLVSLVLGLILSVLLILGRNWWHNNRTLLSR